MYSLIHFLRHRKTWAHNTKNYNYTLDSTDLFSIALIRDICKHLENGKRVIEIVDLLKPTRMLTRLQLRKLVSNIYNKYTYTNISKDYKF